MENVDGMIYVLAGAVVFMMIIVVIVFKRFYIKCPADKMLVVYGSVSSKNNESMQIYHGGSVFVWPIFQAYEFIDLNVIGLDGVQKVFSSENDQCTAEWQVTVAVSTDPVLAQNASQRLAGISQGNIKSICEDIISGQIRILIAQVDQQTLESSNGIEKLHDRLRHELDLELSEIGIKTISTRIKDIRFPSKPVF